MKIMNYSYEILIVNKLNLKVKVSESLIVIIVAASTIIYNIYIYDDKIS